MKESIITLSPRFSMSRMVKQYMDEFYLPAINTQEAAEMRPAAD